MKTPKFKSYKRLNGHDEFVEFYQQLPIKDRKKLIALIKAIQQQGLLIAAKMEWIKKLDSNLYEIRSKVASNIQRGLYFHDEEEQYIITHGFTKNTQKTPAREIKHAKKLRAEYYQRKEDEKNG
ncbi:type II toxin-antitoxin system RelE/ParE family toxin [Bombilactobacillus bombi]|uniref:type II toxin-antitoxin system RelE/ParE family toxin n=1 Tax=Bombilactobacillus bombi TaxID=1303590 RepID=UPI000E597BF4|nr:type II toxin-antitoxin system RelE/ParE family toxin [Bombilactobacillus bombi]AXX64464.1 type II toxin-antitoxin system RelE/ParE family toxin [Bombilactobacillus bombi]